MLLVEMLLMVALVVLAVRARPPERQPSPRILSALAGLAIVAFGVAMGSIVILPEELVFSIALLVAGASAAAFLWLARGGVDEDEDDDDGGEPRTLPPDADADGGRRLFGRKLTRPVGPRTPTGSR
jgi:hypothetical protein